MKTKITSSFNYGAWCIRFKKEFELPFMPFYGMWLWDGNYNEVDLELISHDYRFTMIGWDSRLQCFIIDSRYKWPNKLDWKEVESQIELYKIAGWERTDDTNLEDFKRLILRNYPESSIN